MAIIVLGFISILLATFGVVIAMTRQSPNEQTIAQRMALIRIPAKKEARATAETTQLFKATRGGQICLAGRDPAKLPIRAEAATTHPAGEQLDHRG
jgi:hypothetical protein